MKNTALHKIKRAVFTLMILGCSIVYYSCAAYSYYPNTVNAPLLKEKGEIQRNIILSQRGIELQRSEALTDHICFQVNGQYAANYISRALPDTSTYTPIIFPIDLILGAIFAEKELFLSQQAYLESGLGYYHVIPGKKPEVNYVCEAYVGGGMGYHSFESYDDHPNDALGFYKIFGQLNLGRRARLTSIIIGVKESYIKGFSRYQDDIIQENTPSKWFFEPYIIFSLGNESKGSIALQIGKSFMHGKGEGFESDYNSRIIALYLRKYLEPLF